VIEAHGGLERWAAVGAIRGRVRSGGLLIRTRVPGNRFGDVRLEVAGAEPVGSATPFPRDGQRCRGRMPASQLVCYGMAERIPRSIISSWCSRRWC